MSLSRRDRAAMLLALEGIRHDVRWMYGVAGTGVPLEVLAYGPGDLYAAVMDARVLLLAKDWRTATRLLRARLALALRVLLRASGTEESGAPGGYAIDACETCGGYGLRPGWYDDVDCVTCDGCGTREVPIRVRALWEMAPPHRGAP
jgi:hypothetical protein